MDFTDNMKRISKTIPQLLKHSQEENFEACQEDLEIIKRHAKEAKQQVDDLIAIRGGG